MEYCGQAVLGASRNLNSDIYKYIYYIIQFLTSNQKNSHSELGSESHRDADTSTGSAPINSA